MHTHIGLDGPAGAGKSTIAKAVAKKLNIPYLDTGAMYRTLALFALRNGVDPNDADGVTRLLKDADICVEYCNGSQRMFLNGKDVTDLLRTETLSKGASDIGVHAQVREKLVKLQQRIADKGSIVMDGRDICTVVMPLAEHKFFITASARVRAERRLKELIKKNQPQVSLDEMEKSILERDHLDTTRDCGPLKKAQGALVIDTTDKSIEESVEAVLSAIRSKSRGD
ncbi:MAG: Cytidylate kinase [Firmicutes bacterium ADurb.Bin356]|nr:MAG: Cytidylate kinase [Firmicutes bacterium ADurb.Bin356]